MQVLQVCDDRVCSTVGEEWCGSLFWGREEQKCRYMHLLCVCCSSFSVQ